MSVPEVSLTEETIFTWGAPPLKFGAGAVDEIGFEMAGYRARRVLIRLRRACPWRSTAHCGQPAPLQDRVGDF
jgi:hypothetical protein